jgi:hypothetical protein
MDSYSDIYTILVGLVSDYAYRQQFLSLESDSLHEQVEVGAKAASGAIIWQGASLLSSLLLQEFDY